MKDKTISDALFDALLNHYWLVRDNVDLQPYQLFPKGHLISYSALCRQAGVPFLTQAAGGPLHDIAVYCDGHGWPPINALAVNAQSRYPGPGYFAAPGCSNTFDGWVSDVQSVLTYPSYPRLAPVLS